MEPEAETEIQLAREAPAPLTVMRGSVHSEAGSGPDSSLTHGGALLPLFPDPALALQPVNLDRFDPDAQLTAYGSSSSLVALVKESHRQQQAHLGRGLDDSLCASGARAGTGLHFDEPIDMGYSGSSLTQQAVVAARPSDGSLGERLTRALSDASRHATSPREVELQMEAPPYETIPRAGARAGAGLESRGNDSELEFAGRMQGGPGGSFC